MPGPPKIVVVGSSNTDMVVKTDRLPQPGETILGGEFAIVPGGKGANQAVAAARLGADVTLVARLGIDAFGESALENFQEEGINTRFIVRDPDAPSGVALIFVDANGENMIVVAPGANSRLSVEDVENAADAIRNSSALLLQLEVPMDAVVRAAEIAHTGRVKVLLTPAPARQLPRHLLEMVDVLIPNEIEAATLLGLSGEVDEQNARRLLDLGINTAVLTLGAKGALIVTPDDATHLVPARKVDAVDSTAAGDAFAGALAVRLASGSDIMTSVDYACRAAAVSVTKIGAQSSLPTSAEVDALC